MNNMENMDKATAARADNYAIASLVLGVTSVMLALLLHIGLICAILAVCFAGKAIRLGCDAKFVKITKLVSTVAIVLVSLVVLVTVASTVRGCVRTFKLISCTAENIGEYTADPEGYLQQLEQRADSVFSFLRGCFGGCFGGLAVA